ncbi:hypothetical protein [Calothrix sp. 336/3]|uniref:hypothetical protein n=1 Tax=Calothrix sp. 336/3 TaxID=1337936 RepID=UPI0004E38BC8|nr:hypothetical protein [Calothrix sp. 336/3]AKG20534.1 hypothetical protein IJ00_03680 [Calothrix sp. 336/3]
MSRLNKRSFEILYAELQKCAGNSQISQIEKQIVLKRWERLRQQEGNPVTYEELRETVIDTYPQFSDRALKQAVKANRPPGIFSKIKWIILLGGGATGVLWVLNLPYPMIRYPVARTAPILLLPSYINMDSSYRGAINSVEQADQLVNKATSQADIELGATKVKEAQKHLSNLPVWFLGYYPQVYCRWFTCTWKFTLDEFETARKNTARMEAKIFQEQNAFKLLETATDDLNQAKQQYESAKDVEQKNQAIATMETAMDKLSQIPRETLAGRNATTKLQASQRNLGKITTGDTGKLETGSLIEAAKLFAMQAAQMSQKPPHPTAKWEQVEKLWSEAIRRLENIQVSQANYLEAQKLLAIYKTNLGIVQTRKTMESESQQILSTANQDIQRIIANPPGDRQQFKAVIQGIITKLKTVKPGTTAYKEAQQLLIMAQRRLEQS